MAVFSDGIEFKKSYEVALAIIFFQIGEYVCLPVNSVAVQMEREQPFGMLVPTYRVAQCHNHNHNIYLWHACRVPVISTSYCRFIFQDCVLTWLLCSQAVLNNSRLLTSSCSLSYDRFIGSFLKLASSLQSAMYCDLFQFPVSSSFLKVIQ